MEELRQALNELYVEFGHNEVTQRASEILDRYIIEAQRGNLECMKLDKQ
ncbi:Spo0E family sporulation regulatory protein-aspartic acid phosphatase [Romboutsia maritimum]|nr:Spo0E family sporulation regulatory protein-aspartic acid phosphatase [Romboutsia maritimum]